MRLSFGALMFAPLVAGVFFEAFAPFLPAFVGQLVNDLAFAVENFR